MTIFQACFLSDCMSEKVAICTAQLSHFWHVADWEGWEDKDMSNKVFVFFANERYWMKTRIVFIAWDSGPA